MRLATICTTLALMLAVSPAALAQATTTTPKTAPPAATTTPPPADRTAPAASARSADQPWYTHQASEMRASKLIGTNVVNAANETVGEINDVILGKDGKVNAVVIGVGGFLGMGERDVALTFQSLQMNRDNDNNLVIVANTTKDALKAAPEWKWDQATK